VMPRELSPHVMGAGRAGVRAHARARESCARAGFSRERMRLRVSL
jgi:hypothetical protein